MQVTAKDIEATIRGLGHDPNKVASVRLTTTNAGVTATVVYTHRLPLGDDE